MIKFGMTVADMIAQLTRGFTKQTGRIPSGLEKIKIQQEAIQRAKDMNKVLDMKGNPIDPAKPIMGGVQGNVDPNSEIAKSLRMESDAEKRLKKLNMSDEEINLRGDSPYDTDEQILQRLKNKNKEAIERLKNKKDPPEELAYGGVAGLLGERTNYRKGGDTMGGKNDKSKTSKGPDRSRVSPQQESNHQDAMNRASDRPDYSQAKQLAKQVAINTAKNVGSKKLAGVLGLSQYANPIGQFMAVKSLYDKFKNPSYDEEDMTLGIVSEQQQKEIDKQANAANLMNDKGVLTDIEKNTIFDNVKPFDDQGSSGIFGIGATEPSPMTKEEFDTYITEKGYAEGGIARLGFAGGGGMSKRGFLKLLGGSVATVTAFKTGLIKMLGKDSGAVTKKALDKFIVQEGAGAPAWLEPLVNRALKEGTDKTKALAIADGQIVKSLDTPTGNVDVYYDTRTGAVDIDYIGSGTTTMDEPLQMSYKPGVADEGTKGIKPDDEFSAVESIPEINQSSGNFSGSHKDLEFGENVSNNVEGLYSDTSELAKLGGKNPLIKEISESIQKKKFLKKMNDDPQQFAMENVSEYYD